VRRTKIFTIRDITYTGVQRADLRRPALGGPFPVVLVISDGGFSSSDKAYPNVVDMAERLTRDEGFATLAIEVREAPAYHSPDPQDDCVAAVQWIVDNADRYNLDASRIASLGGSGGGHMATYLASKVRLPAEHRARLLCGVEGSAPTALWLMDNDGSADGHQKCEAFVGVPEEGHQAEWEAASPISQITPEFAPLFIAHSLDDSVPYPQGTRMKTALDAAGVRCNMYTRAGSLHGGNLLRASDVWPNVTRWLHEYLG
jgi:acetyl esterase/lipase